MNILDLTQPAGFSVRRVAATNGGEWAGPCPFCGGSDRFLVWPEKGETGAYWCRQCNARGDLIQYLRDVRKMTFREACQFVGRELSTMPPYLSGKKSKTSPTQHYAQQAPQKETSVVDPALWQSMARKLVDEAVFNLWTYRKDVWLKWLIEKRGLDEETIKAASLGVMLLNRWPSPESWGLLPQLKENGQPKKLYFPQGHVIPLIEGGEVSRIKFRRPKSKGDPRYLFLRGSSPAARVINPQSPFFVLVENELDSLLVAQEGSILGIGVIGLGSASIQPDSLEPEVRATLKKSSCILVALDSDRAGAKAAWGTWLRKFPQAHRWPPVKGKDIAEMWQAGVSLKTWLEVGLEK